MIQESLNKLFKRDLTKLSQELEAYTVEENLWRVDGEIINSGGNLSLHLVGNLNHFIGAILGGTGYVRKRSDEFELKDVPRSEMLKEIAATISVLEGIVPNLTDDRLSKTYPIEVFGKPMTTMYFLMHLSTHLSYHLGQVNYHRRILDN